MLAGTAHRDHVVQFYEDEASLCETVARFVGAGIGAGECVLVIARASRTSAVRRRLTANAIDLDPVVSSGQLTFLDAEDTLARIMVDDMPDVGRFLAVVGGALFASLRGRPSSSLRAYGEMVDILVERGNRAAAIALEGLWNELAREQPFRLLCAYELGRFASSDDIVDFDAVCWAHTSTLPSDCVTRQRERALELEVERRKHLEREIERLRATN